MKACIRCLVSGRVQGVFFRATAKQEAERLGISGWARNLPDGRVEVLACGESESLDAFRGWLREGPPKAQVDSVEEEERPLEDAPEGFSAG